MLIQQFVQKIGKNIYHCFSNLCYSSRYFSYSPRYAAPISTKYHSFTFIYLQNAIDRAIIYQQTDQNVSYGVQTQQMPYPCWVDDRLVFIH